MHAYIASDSFAWPYHASAAIAVMLQCHLPASRAGQPHDQRSDVWCKALDNSSTDLNRKHIWIIWSNQNLIRIYCTGPILWFSMIILYSTREEYSLHMLGCWTDRVKWTDRVARCRIGRVVLWFCSHVLRCDRVRVSWILLSALHLNVRIKLCPGIVRFPPMSPDIFSRFAAAQQKLSPLRSSKSAPVALSALCLDLEAEVPAGHCSGSRGWGLECECRSHNKDFFT